MLQWSSSSYSPYQLLFLFSYSSPSLPLFLWRIASPSLLPPPTHSLVSPLGGTPPLRFLCNTGSDRVPLGTANIRWLNGRVNRRVTWLTPGTSHYPMTSHHARMILALIATNACFGWVLQARAPYSVRMRFGGVVTTRVWTMCELSMRVMYEWDAVGCEVIINCEVVRL